MAAKTYNKVCLYCSTEFVCKDKRRKFCNCSCASSHTGKNKVVKQSTKDKISKSLIEKHKCEVYTKKISDGLKLHYKNNPESKLSREVATKQGIESSLGKHNRDPQSLMDLSKRTVSKILKRLNIGCCVCGWNEALCDIHHIYGRKIENADDHKNLAYLCPNCHRKFHRKKIGISELVTLDVYIGDKWKSVYYG